MKITNEFETYYRSLDITAQVITERFGKLISIVKRGMAPDEEIVSVFISEYKNNDADTRVYNSIFVFTSNGMIEIKEPLNGKEIHFDYTILKNNIAYVDISSTNYDYVKADDNSRMKVMMKFGNLEGMDATLKASGINCEQLWEITQELIRPNLSR